MSSMDEGPFGVANNFSNTHDLVRTNTTFFSKTQKIATRDFLITEKEKKNNPGVPKLLTKLNAQDYDQKDDINKLVIDISKHVETLK